MGTEGDKEAENEKRVMIYVDRLINPSIEIGSTGVMPFLGKFKQQLASMKEFEWNEEKLGKQNIGNALKYSRNLSDFTVYRSEIQQPNLYQATSLHFLGTEELAALLQCATFMEMKQNPNFQTICQNFNISTEVALTNALKSDGAPEPISVHFLSIVTGRNIIYHLASIEDKGHQRCFGNFQGINDVHVLEKDNAIFPLLPPTDAQSDTELKTACRENSYAETNVNECSVLCSHCQQFSSPSCIHISENHLIESEKLQLQLVSESSLSKKSQVQQKRRSNQNTEDIHKHFDVWEDSAGSLFDAVSYSITSEKTITKQLKLGLAASACHPCGSLYKEMKLDQYSSSRTHYLKSEILANNAQSAEITVSLLSRYLSRKIYIFRENHSCQSYDYDSSKLTTLSPIVLYFDGMTYTTLTPKDSSMDVGRYADSYQQSSQPQAHAMPLEARMKPSNCKGSTATLSNKGHKSEQQETKHNKQLEVKTRNKQENKANSNDVEHSLVVAHIVSATGPSCENTHLVPAIQYPDSLVANQYNPHILELLGIDIQGIANKDSEFKDDLTLYLKVV